MIAFKLTVLIAAIGAGPPPNPGRAADAVTLRDGKVVLGQLIAHAPPGRIRIIVRRAWAAKEVPELLKGWEAQEEPTIRRARTERRQRLERWKRQRAAAAAPGDRILAWIDRELSRPEPAGDRPRFPLLAVSLKNGEIREVNLAAEGSGKLLRLGWQCEFPNPEALSRAELESALEDRGFDLTRPRPVSIDGLLPPMIEDEKEWLARRAATEVSHDPGLAFVDTGAMLVPDPAGHRPGLQGFMMSPILPDPAGLPGHGGVTAVARRLRELVPRGRVGAIVTSQEIGPELDAATAAMTLWIRGADGSWAPRISRTATVRAADIREADLRGPGARQPFQMSFAFSQSTNINGEVFRQSRQSSPNLGAALMSAARKTRENFEDEVAQLALKIE